MNNTKKFLIGVLAALCIIGTGFIVFFVLTADNTDDRAEAGEERTPSYIDEDVEISEPILVIEEDEIDFEEDEEQEEQCMKGDIDCDGKITMKDFHLLREDLAEFESNGWNDDLKRSDLNNDEEINEDDYDIFMELFENAMY